jgi:SAM-dependent methyltransferase
VLELAAVAGLRPRLHVEDRRVLERVIIPHFARQPSIRRAVLVGCDWYTAGYERLLSGCECWTIDFDPAKRRFGAKGRHIVGAMEDLTDWFDTQSVDLVICNGVFGWGLNARANVERAFSATWEVLRPRGVLVLGWNDLPERCPFAPEEALGSGRFAPLHIEDLSAHRIRTDTRHRHVFDFYQKIAS